MEAPDTNAKLAAKLRQLADRIERNPEALSSRTFVTGGEARFVVAGFDRDGMSYSQPNGFAQVNYTIFIGDAPFVEGAVAKHEA